MIISKRSDIVAYIKKNEKVRETKEAYENDEEFREVEKELVSLLQGADGHPEYGEDWTEWLADNIDELLQEARWWLVSYWSI